MSMLKNEYLIALAYSLFGSLSLLCFLNWIVMVSFDDLQRYPYLYPFSVLIGCLSLIICIVLFLFNVYYLKSVKRVWTYIVKEILIIIMLFIPCLALWNVTLKYIGKLF